MRYSRRSIEKEDREAQVVQFERMLQKEKNRDQRKRQFGPTRPHPFSHHHHLPLFFCHLSIEENRCADTVLVQGSSGTRHTGMASTAGGMARLQLRQFVPKGGVVSTASCSYSTATRAARTIASEASEQGDRSRSTTPWQAGRRKLSTSIVNRSSWPAGAVGHAESDDPLCSATSKKGKAKASPTSIPSPPRPKTIADLESLKHNAAGRIPIVCLTAHDFPSALSIRSADVDLCLVGDSLANVALGYTSTQPLSLDAMIHHCQAVKRGLEAPLFAGGQDMSRPPLVIADVPFGVGLGSVEQGVSKVVRLIQETGVDGVKIEGSYEVVELIKRLTDHGVVVMGHLGLQPQRVGATSGYRVQGKTAKQAKELLDASLALQQAGCFSIVLECIPSKVGEYISRQLHIPTIRNRSGKRHRRTDPGDERHDR